LGTKTFPKKEKKPRPNYKENRDKVKNERKQQTGKKIGRCERKKER
jgi:hypothetical protein